jgi:hypothetical protein
MVMIRIRVAVYQRNAQRHPGEGQREVITGSFGNPQGTLDLAHRGIVGPQHANRYPREIDVGDDRGVGQGVGAAGHGQGLPLVVAPFGTTQTIAGDTPRHKGGR